jgi:translation initiation factor 1
MIRVNSRRVYSTEDGDLRRRPEEDAVEAPSGDGIVRVSCEKAGRRGKTVTLVRGVPAGELAQVAADLKRRCGAGGSVKAGVIELQGDHREAAAALLRESGRSVRTR